MFDARINTVIGLNDYEVLDFHLYFYMVNIIGNNFTVACYQGRQGGTKDHARQG